MGYAWYKERRWQIQQDPRYIQKPWWIPPYPAIILWFGDNPESLTGEDVFRFLGFLDLPPPDMVIPAHRRRLPAVVLERFQGTDPGPGAMQRLHALVTAMSGASSSG